MCNSKLDQICFPITFNMCLEADRYCNSPPSHHTDGGCGPHGEPCCIDCYYCLTPFAMVIGILCFPCHMYSLKKREETAIAI